MKFSKRFKIVSQEICYKKRNMEFIRNTYIPETVKSVIKQLRPITDEELIEFTQAMYDAVKKKERELDCLNLKN